MNTFDQFSMNAFRLDGKVAVVTGANQGIGVAFAVALARAGADLFIPHFTDDTAEVRALIEKEGRRVAFLQGDLTDRAYMDSVVPACLKEYGRLDILVNNAGGNCFCDFDTFSDEDFRRVTDISLHACYYLGRRAGLQMKKQGGGKIINIGSVLSFTADKKCPPYVVSKHAVVGITRCFASELGEFGVQTNGIAPGFFATDVNAELRKDPAFGGKITARIPAGRWGNLEDLMGPMVFFASPASDYINGWMLGVDGGFFTTL